MFFHNWTDFHISIAVFLHVITTLALYQLTPKENDVAPLNKL